MLLPVQPHRYENGEVADRCWGISDRDTLAEMADVMRAAQEFKRGRYNAFGTQPVTSNTYMGYMVRKVADADKKSWVPPVRVIGWDTPAAAEDVFWPGEEAWFQGERCGFPPRDNGSVADLQKEGYWVRGHKAYDPQPHARSDGGFITVQDLWLQQFTEMLLGQ